MMVKILLVDAEGALTNINSYSYIITTVENITGWYTIPWPINFIFVCTNSLSWAWVQNVRTEKICSLMDGKPKIVVWFYLKSSKYVYWNHRRDRLLWKGMRAPAPWLWCKMKTSSRLSEWPYTVNKVPIWAALITLPNFFKDESF